MKCRVRRSVRGGPLSSDRWDRCWLLRYHLHLLVQMENLIEDRDEEQDEELAGNLD